MPYYRYISSFYIILLFYIIIIIFYILYTIIYVIYYWTLVSFYYTIRFFVLYYSNFSFHILKSTLHSLVSRRWIYFQHNSWQLSTTYTICRRYRWGVNYNFISFIISKLKTSLFAQIWHEFIFIKCKV